MDDRELLLRVQRLDTDALARIMKKYVGYVAPVLYHKGRQTMPPMDVEELASDVFIALWKNAGDISPQQLKGWLAKVARNKAVDWLRTHRETVDIEAVPITVDDGLWERMDDMERRELIENALAKLNPEYRELFYRRYVLEQSSREIGEQMGLNAATVRTRLVRGRETLRSILMEGGYFHEGGA